MIKLALAFIKENEITHYQIIATPEFVEVRDKSNTAIFQVTRDYRNALNSHRHYPFLDSIKRQVYDWIKLREGEKIDWHVAIDLLNQKVNLYSDINANADQIY